MSDDIIKNALEYYDINNKKYNKIVKKIRYTKTAPTNDIGVFKEGFYDENKKLLFESRVEMIGAYHGIINTWQWAWSIPEIAREMNHTITKIFLYGTKINSSKFQYSKEYALKQELITSRFKVMDFIQVEIHCAIASYLTKIPFIMEWRIGPNKTDHIPFDGKFTPNPNKESSYFFYILDPPNVDELLKEDSDNTTDDSTDK